MRTRLEAWLEGRHVGRFIREADNRVRFDYAADAPETPISLSLPRDGRADKRAASHFLENLLPDEKRTRLRMASVYGARSADVFDLLAEAGGDVAGGLVILPEGESIPTGPVELNPALSRDVADRISSIKMDPDAWVTRDATARFSLAGTQGKFALAEVDGEWYWSNTTVPSTHIVKPGRPELRNLEAAEAAALALARQAGIPAPNARVLRAADQSAFVVERFDRIRLEGDVLARRLHAEDLAQSLGVGPANKYAVSARQVIEKLRSIDTGGGIRRAFLVQLVYNTIVGNADAHAKNYSVLLRPEGVTLAPLYDVVPVGLYPEFDQRLAMRIAGARFPQAAGIDHWRKFARTIRFDEDEMTELVRGVASSVMEFNESAWQSLDDDQAALLRDAVSRHSDVLLR